MAIKYHVRLTDDERSILEKLIKQEKPRVAQYKKRNAQILLAINENNNPLTHEETSRAFRVRPITITRLRQRLVEEGFEVAVHGKRSGHGGKKKLDGDGQAHLIAITCSPPPEGSARWTLNLLRDRMIELKHVDSISRSTIHKELKKNELKPWRNKEWCIPAEECAGFVCAMEDILEVYKRPYDPKRPLVCLDESSKQHTREVRDPIPMKPGKVERYDTEYERNGVSNLFMIFEPLSGWRRVDVTDRRTAVDWANQIKFLVDVRHKDAEKIILVEDNLNTHAAASLYKAFSPEEARRMLDKLEFHYTPKHGSWLDMAEIELSVLSRQCLDRRIPDQETLRKEIKAWEVKRNESKTTMDWRFTTKDARIKLKRLYPALPELDHSE